MASKKENEYSQKVGKDAGKSYAPERVRFTPKTEKCSEILLSRYGKLTLQTTMRAVVYDRYGSPDVLRLADIEQPFPKEDEVRVKIRATTVTRADCATREANRRNGPAVSLLSRLISGLRRPRQRILGNQLAGEVEAVGAKVRAFAVGKHVFGTSGFRFGAHAEFICVRQSGLIEAGPYRAVLIAATRSLTWSRRPATSKRSRRPATSS